MIDYEKLKRDLEKASDEPDWNADWVIDHVRDHTRLIPVLMERYKEMKNALLAQITEGDENVYNNRYATICIALGNCAKFEKDLIDGK